MVVARPALMPVLRQPLIGRRTFVAAAAADGPLQLLRDVRTDFHCTYLSGVQ
jgi:hypothetical protein